MYLSAIAALHLNEASRRKLHICFRGSGAAKLLHLLYRHLNQIPLRLHIVRNMPRNCLSTLQMNSRSKPVTGIFLGLGERKVTWTDAGDGRTDGRAGRAWGRSRGKKNVTEPSLWEFHCCDPGVLFWLWAAETPCRHPGLRRGRAPQSVAPLVCAMAGAGGWTLDAAG
jgi:hypothetical protein